MPQDHQVYSELNKTTWSYTPSLVRWRQRYKGVRESLKVNQEASQILYDLYQASHRIDLLLETMKEHASELYAGKDNYDDVEYLYETPENTTPSTYKSVGIRELSERLTQIDRKLRAQGL